MFLARQKSAQEYQYKGVEYFGDLAGENCALREVVCGLTATIHFGTELLRRRCTPSAYFDILSWRSNEITSGAIKP
jgi:hypothetical protein